MSAQRTIKSFVLHNYGNLISAEDPTFDEKTKTWVAEVKSDYPVFLQDDKTETKLLRFIPIKQIGTVRFNENLELLKDKSTPRQKCISTVRALLETWQDRAERIVVQASADKLVNLPEFRHYFTPIDEIISSLLEEHSISREDVMKSRSRNRQERTNHYVRLLETLNYIRTVEGGYESGEMFLLLHKDCEKNGTFYEELFRKAIISEVLKVKYTALREVFGITRFQPTIHVDSCIYRPSLEAERLINFSTSSIWELFRDYYGRRINSLTLVNILRRLRTVNAINREGNYWSGTKSLLSSMLDIKNQMPELTPPSVAH